MNLVIKVFTPIKRVPTMVGKAQNGQKLPFGPYTLPQIVGGAVTLLITGVCVMTLPLNPALTFVVGTLFTIVIAFGLGLVPYTGVRLISRGMWISRLILFPQPVSASGMPVTAESGNVTMFIEESVVVILADRDRVEPPKPVDSMQSGQLQGLLVSENRETSDAQIHPSASWRAIASDNESRRASGKAS